MTTPATTNYHASYAFPCTICNTVTPNASPTVLFPLYDNPNAHAACRRDINDAVSNLVSTIEDIFSREIAENNPLNVFEAQKKAMEAVHQSCENKSLLEYAKREGIQELKYLCDTVGISAVHSVALKVLMERSYQQQSQAHNAYPVAQMYSYPRSNTRAAYPVVQMYAQQGSNTHPPYSVVQMYFQQQ